MKLRSLFLAAQCIVFAGEALAYEWKGHQHACVVESSRFMLADGSNAGPWNNAPKSIFVNILLCEKYAELHDLEFEQTDDMSSPKLEQRININTCIKNSGWLPLYMIEVKGLPITFEPNTAVFLTDMPMNGYGGTMKFDENGYVNYSEFGTTDSSRAGAWFTLRANCTVLKP